VTRVFTMKRIARALLMGLTLPQISKSDEFVTFFAHGLGGDKTQGHYYHINSNHIGFIEGTLETFNFKDYLNPRSSCLGQHSDMEVLKSVTLNFNKVILVGVSRGAATIVNYLGSQNPEHVMAAVLESPFDSVQTIAQYTASLSNSFVFNPDIYTNFDPNGIQPIKVAHHIALNIPVLLICSRKDTLIPASSTIVLYKKMILAGHKKVHILILDKGRHANILWDEQGSIYRDVVHAFYKKYGLPYNEEFAKAGAHHFAHTTPNLEEVDLPSYHRVSSANTNAASM
jgi:predicted alpha/beta hydrolase family esterase